MDQAREKLVVLYSHGTDNSFDGTGCHAPPKPENLTRVVSFLETQVIEDKSFLTLYLCSHSFEGELSLGTLHKKRAEEIALSVKFLTTNGVPSEHIVIAGQSWGGWSSLYYLAKYKPKVLSILAFAPGIFGQNWNQSEQLSIIEEDIQLFKKRTMAGLVFSHPKDWLFPTDPYHKFVNDIDGLTLVSDTHCLGLTGYSKHAFMFKECSDKYNEAILRYIKDRLKK